MIRLILVMHSLALFVNSLECETRLLARRSDPFTHLAAAWCPCVLAYTTRRFGCNVPFIGPLALGETIVDIVRSVCDGVEENHGGTGNPQSRLVPIGLSFSQKTTS